MAATDLSAQRRIDPAREPHDPDPHVLGEPHDPGEPCDPSDRGTTSGVFLRRDLIRDLDRASDALAGSDAHRELQHNVNALVRALAQQLEDEQALECMLLRLDGHHRFAPRIASLRAAQTALRDQVDRLRRYALRHAPEAMLYALARQLEAAVRTHHAREITLLQDACLTDLGGRG